MAFSDQFLEELRARTGLADVISRRVKLVKKGREHLGLCPFHKEKTPSFTVNEDKGFYHCFGCEAHGGVFDFVMNTEGLTFPEAVEKLATDAGIGISHNDNETTAEKERYAQINSIETLQEILIACATGGSADDEEYRRIRRNLLANQQLREQFPDFLRKYRTLFQFWEFIKHEFAQYKERRRFIWDSFNPLLEELERSERIPSDELTSQSLRKLENVYVQEIWHRAISRRASDPEGAITIARTLLEAVCKHILEDFGIAFDPNTDLPKLYRLTAEALNLAPTQHTEEAFKAILGACQTVVQNLGTLRNKIGDAHAQGRRPIKPKARHAELAVNLAGTMAAFLVSTWHEHKSGERPVA